MPDFLDTLTGYPAFFLMCAFAGLLVPVPEDIPLMYGGIQIASGDLHWAGAIPVGIAGVLVRDSIVFFAGWLAGEAVLRNRFVVRVIGEEKLDRARRTVAERGGLAILVGRFSIGFRVSMFIVAGALGVKPRQFLFWDGLGLLVAVPVWLLLGRLFGEPVIDGVIWIDANARWMLPVVIGVGVVIWWVRRRWRAATPPRP